MVLTDTPKVYFCIMSKYHNKPKIVNGIKFDSTKEANYYLYLKQLQDEGKIFNLKLQVPFELLPKVKGQKVVTKHLKSGDKLVCVDFVKQRPTYYIADFVYNDSETGAQTVVDVKSAATKKKDAYRLKKKMMLALLGIEIEEV